MADREELEKLIQQRQRVLVFLPNTNELQRFVLSGAFDELGADYEFTYVVPAADAARMRAAVPHLMSETNTRVLDISPERFAKWSQVFSLACVRLADRSPSFAIRAGLDTSQPRPAGKTPKKTRPTDGAGFPNVPDHYDGPDQLPSIWPISPLGDLMASTPSTIMSGMWLVASFLCARPGVWSPR